MSQLHKQHLMMSQIRSDTEYLIHTFNIFVLVLYSKVTRNVTELAVSNTSYDDS